MRNDSEKESGFPAIGENFPPRDCPDYTHINATIRVRAGFKSKDGPGTIRQIRKFAQLSREEPACAGGRTGLWRSCVRRIRSNRWRREQGGRGARDTHPYTDGKSASRRNASFPGRGDGMMAVGDATRVRADFAPPPIACR
ncbi:MAG: hypothetical protein A3E78_05790 [Alphaproteobacteria bacterium RIFCSPHIGHO2_12_FULL_63_12]|nr:MAG: hypothetical protein A3E78_05790 [Alphaproteobacteria bacterium RIFCSPHIGHO2_12_FULL_63_12]